MLQPLIRGLIGRVIDERGIVLNDAGGEPQRMVELSHPLRIALGEIVVDGDEVDALAFQGIQIDRQGRHQGFSLTGFHFGDAAAVENHAADQLHVKMPHIELPPRHFPAYGERFGQDFVEGLTRLKPFSKVLSLVG